MDLESYPNERAISRKRREWLGGQVPAQLDLMRVKGEIRGIVKPSTTCSL
jgi:hypothetical protein